MPTPRRLAHHAEQVYPRLRGGSKAYALSSWHIHGLSPPTRGILGRYYYWRDKIRSIPAYAGDPATGVKLTGNATVYPRLRGGSLLCVMTPCLA